MLQSVCRAAPSVWASIRRISTAFVDPRVQCTGIQEQTGGLQLSWGDGHQSFFHSIWLRDHSESNFHPTSGQRELDATNIPLTITPSAFTLTACNTRLHIYWGKGQESFFALPWLRKNCYSEAERLARQRAEPPKILWDKIFGTHFVYTQFESFLSNSTSFRNAINGLMTHGVLFLEGIPPTTEATAAIADRIGCIRRTFYGDVWDTAPKAEHKACLTTQVNDSAFTNIELKPHTDCTYFHDPPALQFFNCAEQATVGGSTWLVDGFRAARELQIASPDAFEFFSTRLVPFRHASPEDGMHMLVHAKVIELNPDGHVVRFRFNNDDRGPLNNLSSGDVPLFYKHLQTLNRIVRSPALSVFVVLQRGHGVIVDNHRVMHGRLNFSGSRNLLGWYMGRDELESCARRIGLL